MAADDWSDFEFERKFLLADGVPALTDADPFPDVVVQSYLLSQDGYAVRVRIHGPAPAGIRGLGSAAEVIDAIGENITLATMTAKGPAAGGTRYEAERELDPLVASRMVGFGHHLVTKVRHSLWLDADGWIIDEFLLENAPLVIAEVERGGPVTDLIIPDFCTTEVSEDDRFRNENLALAPYRGWHESHRRELAITGPRFLHGLGQNRLPG
ncbi:hypothetical protein [Pseudactinotalea sp. HY158]|uniref:hypothetical protein n=1 Tax=Pseudactinotalea sp. HY158 TaxID=2654547 RepID=UPI00129CD3A1|nr:hypothetical protein [Pseudactinotalea sp. HY158]QGH70294.1 hypothetical protein GCE65_12920 [Pseudactinotalea sp. HY158]